MLGLKKWIAFLCFNSVAKAEERQLKCQSFGGHSLNFCLAKIKNRAEIKGRVMFDCSEESCWISQAHYWRVLFWWHQQKAHGIPTVTPVCSPGKRTWVAQGGLGEAKTQKEITYKKKWILLRKYLQFFIPSVCCRETSHQATQEPSLDLFLVIILIAAQLVCAKSFSPFSKMKGSIRESTSACAKNGNARAMQNLLNKYFIFWGEGQESKSTRAEPHKNEAR